MGALSWRRGWGGGQAPWEERLAARLALLVVFGLFFFFDIPLSMAEGAFKLLAPCIDFAASVAGCTEPAYKNFLSHAMLQSGLVSCTVVVRSPQPAC